MEYIAHYDKKTGEKQLLENHLKGVANYSNGQIPPTVNFDIVKNNVIKDIVYWMGYFHDFGKYTDYFQEYLQQDKNSRLKNHAHISACFAYLFLIEKIRSEINDMYMQHILAFLCYLSIRLHHLSLTIDNLFPTENSEKMWSDLVKLSNHLIAKGEEILEDIELYAELDLSKLREYLNIEKLRTNTRYFVNIPIKFKNGRIKDVKWYFTLIYLFSLLIDIDKLDSANIVTNKIKTVSYNNVDNYIQNKHKSNLTIIDFNLVEKRKKAKTTMLSIINSLSKEEIVKSRFFTLTAPTGIGKTLSSLQCVLRLQERIKDIEGYMPRIITAIPFINIIEQTRKEYENVFDNNVKMIIHHRLADFSDNFNSAEEIPIDKSLLEVEAWEGDVILTTFVQLFQSIFTGKNRLLKKVNKLAGSIVVLDEAQAIPEDYMPLVGAVLQMIAKYYGTRFILMTATQPKLLEFGNLLLTSYDNGYTSSKEVVNLLPDYKFYFKDLKRTKFVPLLNNRIDTDEFINLFFEKWSIKKSALIVVNTIKRSINLYNIIKNKLRKEEYKVPLYYLSTNIIPMQRRIVIDEVKKILDKGESVILVSTQTIEAGVDLDFDMAFRDFAPLDSLVQTAGRVNREGKKGKYLPVYIVQLESDSHHVYNLTHRESTKNLLMKKKEILECEYGDFVERYYNMAVNRGISDVSKHIWEEGIIKLNFNELKKFQLINNLGEIYDVFIEKDEHASSLADAYEAILRYNCESNFNFNLSKVLGDSYKDKYYNKKLDIFERKALLRLIIAKMNDYIVQIRVSRIKGNRPIEFKARGNVESPLFWVPPKQIEQYYDENTGFIDFNGDAFVI